MSCKHLYGLTKAVKFWHWKRRNLLTKGLKMRQSLSDPAHYSGIEDARFVDLAPTQVNDTVGAGREGFQGGRRTIGETLRVKDSVGPTVYIRRNPYYTDG